MSKATSSAVRNFNLLPETWRAMVVSSAREFAGTSINPETRKRNRLVDLVFTDVESNTQIHKNYSLDRPSYLSQVLEAVAPGESKTLLDEIDWGTDDVDTILGIEIEMKVYHEEFPAGSGTMQNKVGAARPLNSNTTSTSARDADEDDNESII